MPNRKAALSSLPRWTCLALLPGLAACAPLKDKAGAPSLVRCEYSQPEMGVPFRMVVYARDQAAAQNAAAAAYKRIRELNEILSDYDSESELTRLSQSAGEGRAVTLSKDLWAVLRRSQTLAERTQGAFDITVGPYVTLWRKARRVGQMPKPESLAAARTAVGYDKIRLDSRQQTAQLLAPGMRLDLGGIAKGYAVDEAMKVLRAQGIFRALVSGGGDLAVSDPPPGKNGWRIEIAPLDTPQAPPPKFVHLRNCGLATSGDLFQHVEIEGKRYSHIVDPRTGLGLTDHSLVTVIARDCTTADGLATAISVLGPSAGLKLVEAHHQAAAHIVRQPSAALECFESKRLARFLERP